MVPAGVAEGAAGEFVPPVVEVEDSEAVVLVLVVTAGVLVGVCGAAGVAPEEEVRPEPPPELTPERSEASPAGPPRPRTLPSIDINC